MHQSLIQTPADDLEDNGLSRLIESEKNLMKQKCLWWPIAEILSDYLSILYLTLSLPIGGNIVRKLNHRGEKL